MKQLQQNLRQRFSRLSHEMRYRRGRVRQAIDRSLAPKPSVNPPLRERLVSAVGESFWLLFGRLARITTFGRSAQRMRVRMEKVQDVTASVRERMAAGTDRACAARTRWWDPIYLAIAPWLQTRRRKELLLGLPALLAVILIVCVSLVVTGHRPAITRNTQLLRLAQLAMANRDFPSAAIAYQRLLQVGNNESTTRFGLAQCWAAMGDHQQAGQLLAALAPDDAGGYPPAQRVRAYLLMESADASVEQLALARKHLQFALDADPNDTEAQGMLGTLLLRQGDTRGARDAFGKAAVDHPELNLNAAMLSQKIGDADAAKTYAQRAEAYYRALARDKRAKSDVDPVLALAQSLCVQKDFGKALTTVEELIPRGDAERFSKAASEICTTWQAALDAAGGPNDLDRLRIARAMLAINAEAHDWQLRLLDLASHSTAARASAHDALQELVAGGHAGAEVCFYLGMEALSRDHLPAARELLGRSLKLQPGHAATLNNLACAWLAGDDADAGRALGFAEGALVLDAKNPYYHETRGEALVVLQRWSDAAAELERAIPGLSAKHDARQHLAEVYEHLGEVDRAREQRRLEALDQ